MAPLLDILLRQVPVLPNMNVAVEPVEWYARGFEQVEVKWHARSLVLDLRFQEGNLTVGSILRLDLSSLNHEAERKYQDERVRREWEGMLESW